jgi:hypothetical protein
MAELFRGYPRQVQGSRESDVEVSGIYRSLEDECCRAA